MEADDKFIQFGCWNNLNTKVKDGKEKRIGCLNDVIDLLNDYLINVENKPKFLIVSGDNYYPGKQKDPADETRKIKTIYPDKLREGFQMLPNNLPIYMILGNHDLETNTKKENLYIENLNTPEQKDCKILELEMASKLHNVEYNFCKNVMLKNGTMVLMVDTSIYEEEKNSSKYLQCYNKFFESLGLSFTSIAQIREYQIQRITEAITGKELRNLIIVGHHPFFQLKNKEKEKDKKKEKEEGKKKEKEEGKEKDKKKEKEKDKKEKEEEETASTVKFESDISHSFKPVIAHIYGLLGPKTNYYYLCSDLHLFQKGRIEFRIGAETMRIQQYIVGTGGTEMDPALPLDYAERVKTEDDITYILEDEKAQCGFLECVVKEEGLVFTPIFVNLKGGNKKTKNKRSKRSKRTKKRSKRNKKTK